MGLVVTKGASMVGMPLSLVSTVPATLAVNIMHVGLLPSVTGMTQLFHSDPCHSHIQHGGVKLDGDSQTIRGRRLKDEHWNTLVKIFDWEGFQQ